MSRLLVLCSVYAAVFLVTGVLAPPLRAQVYERVFDFADARNADVKNPGQHPYSQLILARDGHFYGTTYEGGRAGHGTIFRVTVNGEHTVLFEFDGSNGRDVLGDLVQGSDGNFYGMTSAGGSGHGTIYRVTPGGAFTTLVQFTGNGTTNKGSSPRASLVQHPDGYFYGTTYGGGADDFGTVFKVTPEGQLTTLVEFTGDTGPFPGKYIYSSLLVGSDGNLYGTSAGGGSLGKGTIFRLTPSGLFTTLVEFTGNGVMNRGAGPLVGLVEGPDGYFYGTTEIGGIENDGTIFKVSSSGALTTLVEFDRNLAPEKGSFPDAGLTLGADGNFYGTTQYGGEDDYGLVFRMTPGGELTTLVEFTNRAGSHLGAESHAEITFGTDGSLYGTTAGGGTRGYGTVFKLTPAGQFTTLVDFDDYGVADRGANPRSGLVRGSDGTLYGTTALGGLSNRGTIFKITPTGQLQTLVEFTGSSGPARGSSPEAGLVWGADGFLYGTTYFGGSFGYGTVFKTSVTGELTTLVDFTWTGATNRGGYPQAPLTLGSDGHFYGTTTAGGVNSGGTIFKMTPAGALTTLKEFPAGGPPGPSSGLKEGPDGSFYGCLRSSGSLQFGTIYKITPAGVFTQLVSFTGTSGANKGSGPVAELLLASDGLFYGVTSGGGAFNAGTVFTMTTAGVLTTLVEFTSNGTTNKGGSPSGTLCEGPAGTFWGTTVRGGAADYGTVFRMSSSGELTTIREFPSSIDHGVPAGGLTFGADGNVYGTTGGVVFEGSFPRYRDGSVYRLVLSGAPNVTMLSCFALSTDKALLEAQVNARGALTGVVLEYGFDGVTFPNTVPVAAGVSGYQTKLVGTTVSGLNAATTYFCRLKAQSMAGTTYSPVWSLSTLGAPVALSSAATDLAPASARLNGAVNARNYDATVRFEWGTDGNSFPNTLNATPAIVTGNAAVAVSAPVAGLTKGTTYYYRVVAANAGGTTVSGTQSFRTLTEPTAAIGGSFALSTTSVRVDGTVHAQGSDSSVVFEYGTDGVSFPNSVAATPGTVAGDAGTPVSAVLTTLSQGVTYHYRIKATSAGGTGTSSSASFSMNVLSGFAQVFPSARRRQDSSHRQPDAAGHPERVAVCGSSSGARPAWRRGGSPPGTVTSSSARCRATTIRRWKRWRSSAGRRPRC
ncbi:MAG: hypothetical protein HS117_00270 [Verrucomicrobiaceae bacterium]|nr:hypothetical protein [Verrucomicrobiaceae bacterium]